MLHNGRPCDVAACLLSAAALQAYTVRKRLESYMRRLVSSAQAISAVSPSFYATRFRAAMKKVFL